MLKKFLAMLLAALMLISVGAMAEDVSGGQLIIRDVVIDMDDEMLDLSGLELILAAAADETQAGLRVALEGAGKSALNAIAALGAEQLTLHVDGLSDVYSIQYEDLLALVEEAAGDIDLEEAYERIMDTISSGGAGFEIPEEIEALIVHTVEIFSDDITYDGTDSMDDVEYAAYSIAVSESEMDVLLDDLAVVLDVYAQAALGNLGYDSYREMLDDADLHLSVDGEVYMAEAEIVASIDVNAFVADATEPETLNIYVDVTKDFEYGTVDFYVSLSGVDGEETEEIVTFLATYTEVDGEFGEFDLAIYGPYSDEANFYASVCAPSNQGEGLWEFYMSIEDGFDSVSFYLDFGSVDGQDQLYAHVIYDEDVVYIDYAGADGVGELSLGMMDGEESLCGVYATIELAADDGAWLPGEASETVNLLTVDETQSSKVSMEAMSLLFNAMGVLSEANETVAALIGGMMG